MRLKRSWRDHSQNKTALPECGNAEASAYVRPVALRSPTGRSRVQFGVRRLDAAFEWRGSTRHLLRQGTAVEPA